MKTVLAFDTATPWLSAAVCRGGTLVAEEDRGPGPSGRPRHATELLPAIERCVAAAGGWARIDLVAVGVGPGTFTGLRIGIATARAIAQARELPVAGVGSLAALAAGIAETRADRVLLPVLDARRTEAFAALYEPDGAEVWAPFVAGPEVLADRLAPLHAAPVAAGDGSLRFRQHLEAAGAEVLPEADEAHRVWARHVCGLAVAVDPARPESIRPIYLRRPDAELWRERDRGSGNGE